METVAENELVEEYSFDINTADGRVMLWPAVYGAVLCEQGDNLIYSGDPGVILIQDVIDNLYDQMREGRFFECNDACLDVDEKELADAVKELLWYMEKAELVYTNYEDYKPDVAVGIQGFPEGKF